MNTARVINPRVSASLGRSDERHGAVRAVPASHYYGSAVGCGRIPYRACYYSRRKPGRRAVVTNSGGVAEMVDAGRLKCPGLVPCRFDSCHLHQQRSPHQFPANPGCAWARKGTAYLSYLELTTALTPLSGAVVFFEVLDD